MAAADARSGLPLVYACAGCSPVARLAYDLAQHLDRRGLAEMSCLAGLGAALPKFMKQLDGREAWVIDGCPLECGKAVFARNGRPVEHYVRLDRLGFRKRQPVGASFDMDALVARVVPSRAPEAVG